MVACQQAFEAAINAAVCWLRKPYIEATSVAIQREQRAMPLIELHPLPDGSRFSPTKAGSATHLCGLKPEEGVVLLHSLKSVMARFRIGSTLQLTLLLTPFREAKALKNQNEAAWALVHQRLSKLPAEEQMLLQAHGVDFGWLATKAQGMKTMADLVAQVGYQQHLARQHLRAYDAIVVRELHRGRELDDIARRFGYAAAAAGEQPLFGTLGELETIRDSAETYMAQVKAFCEELGEHDLAGVIGDFRERKHATEAAQTREYAHALQAACGLLLAAVSAQLHKCTDSPQLLALPSPG